MRISQRTKYVLAVPAFVIASVVTQFAHVIPTYAATLTWTGSGDGTSFSDGANWSTGSAPVNGDALTFSHTGVTQQRVLDNDISALSVVGITFSGVASDYYSYTLQGNPLTVSGAITDTSTGAEAEYVTPVIQNNLVLNGNTTVNGVNIGTSGTTLNLSGFSLGVSGDKGCGNTLYSNLSGSGALNITGDGINVRGANASYTGPIAVTGYALFASTAFGATSAGTAVSGAGKLAVVHTSDATIAEPLTLGGSGTFASHQNWFGCAGGSGQAVKLTATGGVTLTSNFQYAGENNFVINEPYTSNGHSFTVKGGVVGTLTTPQGAVEAPVETIQLDGTDTDFVSIGNKQTGVLNGTRDYISVAGGGVLKGTGTATDVYINEDAVLAPGNSPGTITVLETLGLSGELQSELLNKDSYDKVVVGADYSGVGNAVSLQSGSSLNVVLYDGWTINQGETFTIIDNQSSTAVQGTFDGLAEGAQIVIDGITFSISYVGGDGNDVVLTALNTGTDPGTPNTGVHRFIAANPIVLAGLGILSAGLLVAIALRRKSTR